MSFLSAVSLRFSVCSPYSLPLTSGRQQESDAGDGEREGNQRLGEQREWHRTTERIARSPAILPANVHLATRKHTTGTPPSFTLDCYHGNPLFSSAVSQRRIVSANHQITPSNWANTQSTHRLLEQCYCANVDVLICFGNTGNSNTFGLSCVK